MRNGNGCPHAQSLVAQAQGRNTPNGSIPQAWLERYWARGMDTVPVDAGSKSVSLRNWNDPMARWREPRMYRNCNIGIRLGSVSGGLVDVDLDTPDACAVAPYILPPTRMRMRKHGKPIAHYFYRCPEPPHTRKWGAVELRSESADGKPVQTVVPPSVDGDGLMREWVDDALEPAEVDADVLQRACTLTAITAAVLPHYRTGARHQLALALAGWLRKCGIAEPEARAVVNALALATSDAERHDRLRAVADTYAKPIESVQGYRALQQLLPDETLAQLGRWLDAPRERTERTAHAGVLVEDAPPLGTDAHSAYVLAGALDGRAAWVDEWGWLVWDGCRWQRDPHAVRVLALARAILPPYYADLARAATSAQQQELYRAAAKACSVNHLKHALELARADLLVPRSRFDADPFLLNCINGVVDLRTGQLIPHDPALYLTKLADAEYHPDADAPTWDRFLQDVFTGDAELIDYMQAALGYSITADTREQKLFLCYGTGANGKTTLFETVRAVLGDYAHAIPTRTLLADGRDDHPHALAQLYGARLALASETAEGRQLNENLMKLLTGGDRITARHLYHEFFSFEATAKVWLFTNHKPIIRDHSHATWRRIVLIPFKARFGEGGTPAVRNMRERLLAEREGILAWLVRGAQRWYMHGLDEPLAVRAAVDEYRRETDSMQEWLTQHTIDDAAATTPARELYDAYAEWCNANGIAPISTTTFGRRLGELGYTRETMRRESQRLRCWRGIRLRTPTELDDPFA